LVDLLLNKLYNEPVILFKLLESHAFRLPALVHDFFGFLIVRIVRPVVVTVSHSFLRHVDLVADVLSLGLHA
jgi:hypothetical protein